MQQLHMPSGIVRGLDFLIDDNWLPEQALAVFELLGDLRARIWTHYCVQLQELIQQQRSPVNNADLTEVDPLR
jgi:hypothetical protein